MRMQSPADVASKIFEGAMKNTGQVRAAPP
jgi:hypothetical protein